MSQPIDVGSVLGGRYKVTATVLTSHDHDLVLDGVDQVLNRPVSILVAGPGNAEQLAQSAREVATGERPGNVQILDLGVSESTTYLIANHSTAPDLLDLVVATNPPYVEPFFTDTLGSEIFGQARSHEPETYDGLYDDDEHDAAYINYDDPGNYVAAPERPAPAAGGAPTGGPAVPPMPASKPSAGGIGARIAAAAAGAGAAAAAAASAVKNAAGKSGSEDPASAEPGRTADANRTVHDDAGSPAPAGPGDAEATDSRSATPAGAAAASPSPFAPPAPAKAPADPAPQQGIQPATQAVPAAQATPPAHTAPVHTAPHATPEEPAETPKVSLWSDDDFAGAGAGAAAGAAASYDRGASNFPASAREQVDAYEDEDYYEDEEPVREPRSVRWLVGGILAAVLVVGLILAVNTLGGLLGNNNNPPAAKQTTPAPTGGNTGTGSQGASSSAPPVAAPPAIEGITRQGDFDFAGGYDKDLVKAFDGNAASYWSNMEFGSEDWGGLVPDGVPLVVKLKEPASIKSITLSQLGASGGSISVYTNDRPAMDGAKLVGTNSFTSPDLVMPLSSPATAQYVIVNIKTLPKLAAPKTRYGYGLRLAEIKVQ
ncbi:ABC transporter substrate-binding protein [Arthrobacter sp. SW1]|uniref:ABC transporter substrate-binding protein n=1 Tax=Arthrobacter sp. SW1 TaxID=1920889 RepID=UPI000877C2AF|nr:ABC transporter substrate-binding protein [Arthrobacter sp. SW1]OFI36485.1 ABC transporter substrate-binding protein [Arthrobacter sp. SW1]